MTSKSDIATWFEAGVKQGATHMVVVCDTFDYEDYPVYVTEKDKVRDVIAKHSEAAGNMQKVMECYDLRRSLGSQVYADKLQMNI